MSSVLSSWPVILRALLITDTADMRDAPELVGVCEVAGLRPMSPPGATGVSILSRTCGFAVGSVGFSLRVNIFDSTPPVDGIAMQRNLPDATACAHRYARP